MAHSALTGAVPVHYAHSIQSRAAVMGQRCQQLTMSGLAKRLWQIFRRLVHGTLEQLRCSPGCPTAQIMQAKEDTVSESLAASLRPDIVTMKLDHDETPVPY